MASALPSPATRTGAGGSRASGIQFRRALVLMLMTLVLPGSAQLVAGRKETGRLALRIWLGLLASVAVLFGLGMIFGSFVFWLLSNTLVLGVVRIVLMVMAVGWAYLFIDAWRLGNPLALRQKQRLAMVGVNGVLCFSVVGSLLFASHMVGVQRDFMSAMFTDDVVTDAHDGRYNILLLGGDSGSDRWGLRPDSLSVASIDATSISIQLESSVPGAPVPSSQGTPHAVDVIGTTPGGAPDVSEPERVPVRLTLCALTC